MKTKPFSKVEEIQNQITLLTEEIASHEKEITEFQETLEMIQEHPSCVAAEKGTIFESLKSLIQSEPEAEMRSQRIRQSKLALDQAHELLKQKKNTVDMLQQLLVSEQSEEQWQRQYQPLVAKYESGFEEAPDPRLFQIQQLEKDIAQFRPQLAAASEWVQSPDYAKPKYFYSRDPKRDAEYLPSAIQVREEKIEKLRSQPGPQRDEKKFRNYIQSRVEIEPSLQNLLEAQERYAQAFLKFKAASIGREAALGFSVEELTKLSQVLAIANNKIILLRGAKNG